MPAPSSADLTAYRSRYSSRAYLALLAPAVVLAAQVNQTTFEDPLTTLAIDSITAGAAANVREGMTLMLGSAAGKDDRGRVRVISATSTAVTIRRTSRGRRPGELDPADNLYVTVLDLYEVWAKLPYITDDGVTYKDGAVAYSATLASPPVANAGVWWAGFVNESTNVATVSFDGTGSWVTRDSGTLTYSWNFKDGTPSSSTSATVSGVTFPPGARWVELTVNDGTASHTARALVVACTRAGVTAPIANLEVTAERRASDGASVTVDTRAAVDVASFPTGTAAILFKEEWYGGVLGSLGTPAGRAQVKFAGWLDTEPLESAVDSGNGVLRRVTRFNLIGAAGRLRTLPGFPQEVNRTSTGRWEGIASDIRRYWHALLQWHSTVLEVADYLKDDGWGDDYPITTLASNGGTLYDQVNELAENVAARFTCTARGQLAMRRDPLLQATADRTSVVQLAIGEDDWTEARYEATPRPRVHWLNAGAIVASATTVDRVFSIAPGRTPGQGETGEEDYQELVLNQSELNIRTGHRYARRNAPQGELTLTLARGGDLGLDPAYLEWVTLTVSSATAARRGLGFTSARFLLTEVSFEATASGRHRVTLRLERETTGQPGRTVIPPTPVTIEPTVPNIEFPNPFELPPPGLLPRGVGRLAMVMSDGTLKRTADFSTPASAGGPTWDSVTLSLDGTVCHAVVDAFSPLYISGAGGVNIWLVTTTRLYYISDIFGAAPTVTVKHLFAASVTSNQRRTLAAERGFQNYVAVASYYGADGTKLLHSTDNTTFTETTVTAVASTNATFRPIVHVSGKVAGLVYVGAYDDRPDPFGIRSNLYRTYINTGSTPVFTDITSSFSLPDNGHHLGDFLYVPWANNPTDSVIFAVVTDANWNVNYLYRNATNITPKVGTISYAPRGANSRRRLGAMETNRGVLLAAATRADTDGSRLFATRQGEASTVLWDDLTGDDQPGTGTTNAYYGLTMSGDNPNVGYVWGQSGRIDVLTLSSGTPLTATLESRKGSLSTTANVIAIMGG